jgi:hypothetical protein
MEDEKRETTETENSLSSDLFSVQLKLEFRFSFSHQDQGNLKVVVKQRKVQAIIVN